MTSTADEARQQAFAVEVALRARRLREKPALWRLYDEHYQRYAACVERARVPGAVVEIGAGGGFAEQRVPEIIKTDIVAAPGIHETVDATAMPFADGSVRAFLLMNVLHHIPRVTQFFAEASRCLAPGGRMLIIDEYPGYPGRVVLKYAHHEGFDDTCDAWDLPESGPLAGANGALAWLIFQRDIGRFRTRYPSLHVDRIETHTPLRYWLAGGLKGWSALPSFAFDAVTHLERRATKRWPRLASFVDIELVRG